MSIVSVALVRLNDDWHMDYGIAGWDHDIYEIPADVKSTMEVTGQAGLHDAVNFYNSQNNKLN